MAPLKSKKTARTKSFINKFRSPYLKKTVIPDRKKKRPKKRKTLSILPPTRLKNFNQSKIKKIAIGIAVTVVALTIMYLLFFSNLFVIKKFQIIDEGTVITDNLELNEILGKNLLKKNLFLVGEKELKQIIVNTFPDVEDIKMQKSLPDKVILELKKYPTVANLIDTVKSLDGIQIQKKYLINSNGIIIAENEENPDLPYLKIFTSETLALKSKAIGKEQLDYTIKLINLFEEKFGMSILEAEYFQKEREVHLKTEKLFYVWVDLAKDMIEQIEKLKKALPKLDIYKTPLKYIDLRIAGTDAEKVIYCLIDKPCARQN